MDRVVDQSVSAPTPMGGAHAELVRRRWAYDANGRVTAIADARWGSTFYRYDSLGQLLQAARGKLNEVFEYDVTGSLTNILDDVAKIGHARPWFTKAGNQLVNSKEARYENDVRGRRTKKIVNDEWGEATDDETEYFWDCRDRLREVRFVDGRRVLFKYDAFGRRIRKDTIPAERADVEAMALLALEKGKEALPPIRKVEFWWDGDAIAGEVDSAREEARRTRVFVHEPGTLVPMLQSEGGEVFGVVNDHLGMPKELVDRDGRVAWAAAHSAWGRVVETRRDPKATRGGGVVESPFRLLGQWFDDETGLCSTRFRYFDPQGGRWLSAYLSGGPYPDGPLRQVESSSRGRHQVALRRERDG